MTGPGAAPRALLEDLFRAAVAAADPRRFVAREVARTLGDRGRAAAVGEAGPVWVIALGKAAPAMTEGAIAGLGRTASRIAGGLIVAPEMPPAPHPAIAVAEGDHPVPGMKSAAAAVTLLALTERIARSGDGDVLLLLSGGTSSLIGAPVPGLRRDDVVALTTLMLGSGAPIAEMNAVRKRFARWGAGRLAVALAPARVRPIVLSDVPDNDLAAIGSGPVSPDPTTAADIEGILEARGLLAHVPREMRDLLSRTAAGATPETPKPGDAAFTRVAPAVVMDWRAATAGAARRAEALGLGPVHLHEDALTGDAAAAGARLAGELAAGGAARCLIAGGETTVRLGEPPAAGEPPLGGRCQELALAAALRLEGLGPGAAGITLLAAGTDGRDGPTDAAGAVVDAGTAGAARRAGRDPEADLRRHDAWRALDAAGALLRTGLTGTNVMDVVLALRTPAPAGASPAAPDARETS